MPALPHPFALFMSRLAEAAALRRQRRGLARLDDHLLSDIGLTRAEALAEADRPAWDAPRHWRAPAAPDRGRWERCGELADGNS